MPQSLVKNYVHLIFSTKYREHLIYPPVEDELYAYLGGECKRLECQPIKIGGYTDHIHILCMLSKKIALMKLLEQIKSNSSKWMKTKGKELEGFYWQDARLNGTGPSLKNNDDSPSLFATIKSLFFQCHHPRIFLCFQC